jgi:hypothetical protein
MNLRGEQQKAFDEIKRYMKEPLVLVPPQLNKTFKLYMAADAQTRIRRERMDSSVP